jgi:hypothetical protein
VVKPVVESNPVSTNPGIGLIDWAPTYTFRMDRPFLRLAASPLIHSAYRPTRNQAMHLPKCLVHPTVGIASPFEAVCALQGVLVKRYLLKLN